MDFPTLPQPDSDAQHILNKSDDNSTPKIANRVQTMATKYSTEPEWTPEERRARKEKEILFLRHRLQRGLLPREGSPVPDEMKQVSDFLGKLETFPDLEVSIIKATKINKVLKAILKLETISKEEEFHFKPRSQTLLNKWNILLGIDAAPTPGAGLSSANANGVNKTAGATTKAGGVASEVNDLKKDAGIIVPFDGPPNALKRMSSHSGDLLNNVKRRKKQVSDEDEQSLEQSSDEDEQSVEQSSDEDEQSVEQSSDEDEQSIDEFKQYIKQSVEKVFNERRQIIDKMFDERQQFIDKMFDERRQFTDKMFDERQQSIEQSIDRFERSVQQSLEPILRRATRRQSAEEPVEQSAPTIFLPA
ncbi:hypothetical protein EV127DRAFT_499568 [Xylaria flabelliformis]|nr:hypothetical protein EV127DRAFT_499568 [Xylaria flabelliformis]